MLSKATIKFVQLLKDKKNRQEHGLFLVEGNKTVAELLASNLKVKTLFATERWLRDYHELLKTDTVFEKVSDIELKKLSNLVTPQDVVALVEMPGNKFDSSKITNSFSIALDGIQDPGNFGTILRIADWYGIQNIICSPQCADVYNPKVIQSAMGSFIRVNVFYTSLNHFFEANKNIQVYGAVMNGDDLYTSKINSNGILLIGNEGSGISEDLNKFVTKALTIPRKGNAESLNAAIATAIICDAWARGH